jgi:hypothetical protein
MMAGVGELFFSSSKPKDDVPPEPDQEALELFAEKQKGDIFETNIRIAVSARDRHRAKRAQLHLAEVNLGLGDGDMDGRLHAPTLARQRD